MRNRVVLGVVIGLTSLVLGTAQADSADLTGIWLGEQKCDSSATQDDRGSPSAGTLRGID